jgi:hypothetical protein
MYMRDINFPRRPLGTLVGNGGYEVSLISESATREADNLKKTPIKPFMEEAPDLTIPAGTRPRSPEFS